MKYYLPRCVWVYLWCLVSAAAAAEETAAPAPVRVTRVAVFDDVGVSSNLRFVLQALAGHDDLQLQRITAREIQQGRLAGFDVLIQPGGRSTTQSATLQASGRQQVRDFVQRGGGYLGICAGAYLAAKDDEKVCLGILDARVVDRRHWNRGYGDVEISLSPAGRTILGVEAERTTVYYHQGPLLAARGEDQDQGYLHLAGFESEIAKNGAPQGVMVGTTAIAAGEYGRGKVFCFSPHPERTKGLEHIVYRGLMWTVGR